jgi:hypothetical protein
MGVGDREKHRSSTYATAVVSNPTAAMQPRWARVLVDAGSGERRHQLGLLISRATRIASPPVAFACCAISRALRTTDSDWL